MSYGLFLLYSRIESRIPYNFKITVYFPFLCPLQLTKQGIPKYCSKSSVPSFSNGIFYLVLNTRQIIILKSSYTITLLLRQNRDDMLPVDHSIFNTLMNKHDNVVFLRHHKLSWNCMLKAFTFVIMDCIQCFLRRPLCAIMTRVIRHRQTRSELMSIINKHYAQKNAMI